MAAFNVRKKVDNAAPDVPSLAARTAATPYGSAPSTSPSGPAPGVLQSGVGYGGVQKQMYDKIDPSTVGSLTKKKKS